MKREGKAMEAEQLADILLSTTNTNQISSVLGELSTDEVVDLATTILPNSHTLLHLLVQREKLHALRSLLQRGVGCQARNAQGATPLHTALQHNCLQAARLLIEEGGAKVSEVISRRKGTTLLHRMVACDRPQAVKLLLENKVEINARDREGRTPFHLAAVYGYCAVATLLLRHEQCDVNAYDETGHSALMLAIINDNHELTRLLVDCPRVDVVQRDLHKDRSPLHLAVAQGQLDVVRTLLRRNSANLHSKERSMGRAPIHLACALVCSRSGVVSSNCLRHNDQQQALAALMYRNTALEDSDSHEEDAEISRDMENLLQGKTLTASKLLVWMEEKENQDVDFMVQSKDSQSLLPSQRDSRIRFGSQSDSQTLFPSQSDSQTPFPSQSDSQTPFLSQSNSQTPFPSHSNSPTLFPSQRIDSRPHQSEEGVVVNGHQPSSTTRFCEKHSKVAPATSDVINGNVLVESTSKPPAGNFPRAGTPRKQPTPKQQGIKNHGLKSPSPLNLRTKLRTSDVCSSSRLRTRHSISGDAMLRTPRPKQSTPASGPQKQSSTIVGKKSSIMRPATAPARNRVRSTSSVSFAEPEPTMSVPSTSRQEVWRTHSSIGTVVTPFTIGAIRCRMVSLLLEHGADANLMTAFRKSPLHIAAIMGAADVMVVLLPHVTNINVLSAHNKTALHLAVERNHVAIAAQLIHAGANLSLRDVAGMTALHTAARFGFTDITGLLLRARAFTDCTDFKQMTPIHHACVHNHAEVINRLISAGARLDVVDVAGFKPMDYRKDAATHHDFVDNNNSEPSPPSMKDFNFVSSLLLHDTPSAERVEKLEPSVSYSLGVPQPAQDFQRRGLLFSSKTSFQKAA